MQYNGMKVIVSEALEPNPAWWLNKQWWLDEDFRHKFNANLFEAFGHRVMPPIYIMDVNGLRFLSKGSQADKVIATNEAGLMLLKVGLDKQKLQEDIKNGRSENSL
jgi:hypothetical protein